MTYRKTSSQRLLVFYNSFNGQDNSNEEYTKNVCTEDNQLAVIVAYMGNHRRTTQQIYEYIRAKNLYETRSKKSKYRVQTYKTNSISTFQK